MQIKILIRPNSIKVLSDDVDIVKIHEISGKILSTYELE